MSELNVNGVLLTAKDADENESENQRTLIVKALGLLFPEMNVSLTTSYQDYQDYIHTAGSWAAWCQEIVGRYNMFFLTTRNHGKANAAIIQHAVAEQKPVKLFWGGGFGPVKGITCRDPKNFKSGWEISL